LKFPKVIREEDWPAVRNEWKLVGLCPSYSADPQGRTTCTHTFDRQTQAVGYPQFEQITYTKIGDHWELTSTLTSNAGEITGWHEVQLKHPLEYISIDIKLKDDEIP
jgi:hypothetical protein